MTEIRDNSHSKARNGTDDTAIRRPKLRNCIRALGNLLTIKTPAGWLDTAPCPICLTDSVFWPHYVIVVKTPEKDDRVYREGVTNPASIAWYTRISTTRWWTYKIVIGSYVIKVASLSFYTLGESYLRMQVGSCPDHCPVSKQVLCWFPLMTKPGLHV